MTDRFALYEPKPLGTKALQRLGTKLASREDLTAEEQQLYEEFIGDAKDRVVATQAFVNTAIPTYVQYVPRLSGAEIVGRIKTRSTLTDKLERTPQEKLPSIHDIAGIRIVAGFSTAEQKFLASLLKAHVDDLVATTRPALLVDRLAEPTHGYRALHLIVWPGGRPVEIQIRTSLQHAWAQTMEVLGDRWGREPRYGQAVKGPTESARKERARVVESMKRLSLLIETYEGRFAATAIANFNIEEKVLESAGVSPSMIESSREYSAEHGATLEQAAQELHEMVRSFSEKFGRASE